MPAFGSGLVLFSPRVKRVTAFLVASFVLAAAAGALWEGRLTGVVAQSKSACSVIPDKMAAPKEILLGETVRVTLTLTSSCPPEQAPVDVMLVLDQSNSMADANKLVNAKIAAKRFLTATNVDLSRVGLVAFNQAAGLRSGLTHDASKLRVAIDSLIAGGLTNISGAIDLAREELLRDPQQHQLAMVVLTDGRNTVPADPVPVAAQRAKDAGIVVATFCAGGDCDPGLKDAATDPSYYFDVADTNRLAELYEQLASRLQENSIERLTIRDVIPDNMAYIPGSAKPAPIADVLGAKELVWIITGTMPTDGLSYDLRPLEEGVHPTNVVATGDFVDRRGLPGDTVFPVPVITVRKPGCIPTPLEVYFLIDDSNCLNGATFDGMPSILAIQKAVANTLDSIHMGRDQAAVIGFGDRAVVVQSMTDSRQAVVDAVLKVAMNDSTARLDLGYQEVRKQIALKHDPRAKVVTIAITDGPMMPAPDLVIGPADLLRQAGVRNYVIGVGPLAQHQLLRAVAERGTYQTLGFGGSVIASYANITEFFRPLGAVCAPDVVVPTPTPSVPEPTPLPKSWLRIPWAGR